MYKIVIFQTIILILYIVAYICKTKITFGVFFWVSLIIYIFIFIKYKKHTLENKCMYNCYRSIFFTTSLIVSTMCILPMNLSPMWNDNVESYKKQYEYIADAILQGRVSFNYRADPVLLSMDNPYDPEKRKEIGAEVKWDHSLYKGKYYSYFGVVPVFLVFIPYKLITGLNLSSYHATQLFVALSIIFLYYLFWLILNNQKLKKIPFVSSLYLTSSFSFVIFYYAIGTPAMYCTAITSGIFFEILCILFYFKCVSTGMKNTIYLILGSTFGALIFGCRPPIVMINIVIFPILFYILKNKDIKQFFAVLLPYAIIASLLFMYNYIRFENIFEFGQSYQITLADMRAYTSGVIEKINVKFLTEELIKYFFSIHTTAREWFELHLYGIFINFPILLFSFMIFFKKIIFSDCEKLIYYIYISIFLSVFLSASIDIIGCAYIIEKYHMDTYCAIAIIAFVVICYSYNHLSKKETDFFNCVILTLSSCTNFSCCFFSFMPYDWNFILLNYRIRDVFEDVLWFNFF